MSTPTKSPYPEPGVWTAPDHDPRPTSPKRPGANVAAKNGSHEYPNDRATPEKGTPMSKIKREGAKTAASPATPSDQEIGILLASFAEARSANKKIDENFSKLGKSKILLKEKQAAMLEEQRWKELMATIKLRMESDRADLQAQVAAAVKRGARIQRQLFCHWTVARSLREHYGVPGACSQLAAYLPRLAQACFIEWRIRSRRALEERVHGLQHKHLFKAFRAAFPKHESTIKASIQFFFHQWALRIGVRSEKLRSLQRFCMAHLERFRGSQCLATWFDRVLWRREWLQLTRTCDEAALKWFLRPVVRRWRRLIRTKRVYLARMATHGPLARRFRSWRACTRNTKTWKVHRMEKVLSLSQRVLNQWVHYTQESRDLEKHLVKVSYNYSYLITYRKMKSLFSAWQNYCYKDSLRTAMIKRVMNKWQSFSLPAVFDAWSGWSGRRSTLRKILYRTQYAWRQRTYEQVFTKWHIWTMERSSKAEKSSLLTQVEVLELSKAELIERLRSTERERDQALQHLSDMICAVRNLNIKVGGPGRARGGGDVARHAAGEDVLEAEAALSDALAKDAHASTSEDPDASAQSAGEHGGPGHGLTTEEIIAGLSSSKGSPLMSHSLGSPIGDGEGAGPVLTATIKKGKSPLSLKHTPSKHSPHRDYWMP